jgi:hypothetical protein
MLAWDLAHTNALATDLAPEGRRRASVRGRSPGNSGPGRFSTHPGPAVAGAFESVVQSTSSSQPILEAIQMAESRFSTPRRR